MTHAVQHDANTETIDQIKDQMFTSFSEHTHAHARTRTHAHAHTHTHAHTHIVYPFIFPLSHLGV